MWKLLSTIGSPGATRGKLTVLFFHRVLPRFDPLMPDELTAESFDTMLGWLSQQFNLLPLDEAVRRLNDRSLPPAAAAITFDDGYRDNFEVAAPVLQRRGLPCAFFIASGYIDGGAMWNDVVAEAVRRAPGDSLDVPSLELGPVPVGDWGQRAQAVGRLLGAIKYRPMDQRDALAADVARAAGGSTPADLMMTHAQVRGLAEMGFCIGAHTVSHPILRLLDDGAARQELTRNREQLEGWLDQRVGLFAYPNGRFGKDFDKRDRDLAQSLGFDAAFTTEPGVCEHGTDRWSLPRFTPWDKGERRFRLRLVQNQWHAARPLFGEELMS